MHGDARPHPLPPPLSSSSFGALLREWRQRRRLSQLALAIECDISQRHLSTTTVFGTPVDVTLAELALECFFPADADTAERLRRAVLS